MTQITVNPETWTGRSFYAESPIEWIKGEVHAFLWPAFDCADCIGMMIPHGCYCAAYDAVAPGAGPEPWRLFMRRLFARVGA